MCECGLSCQNGSMWYHRRSKRHCENMAIITAIFNETVVEKTKVSTARQVTCECGIDSQYRSMSNHRKSKRHCETMAIITAIFNETVVEELKVSEISFYDFVEKIQKEFDEQLAEIVGPEPSKELIKFLKY